MKTLEHRSQISSRLRNESNLCATQVAPLNIPFAPPNEVFHMTKLLALEKRVDSLASAMSIPKSKTMAKKLLDVLSTNGLVPRLDWEGSIVATCEGGVAIVAYNQSYIYTVEICEDGDIGLMRSNLHKAGEIVALDVENEADFKSKLRTLL